MTGSLYTRRAKGQSRQSSLRPQHAHTDTFFFFSIHAHTDARTHIQTNNISVYFSFFFLSSFFPPGSLSESFAFAMAKRQRGAGTKVRPEQAEGGAVPAVKPGALSFRVPRTMLRVAYPPGSKALAAQVSEPPTIPTTHVRGRPLPVRGRFARAFFFSCYGTEGNAVMSGTHNNTS